MSTWYDPHAGDERHASFKRLFELPPDYHWLNRPEFVYGRLNMAGQIETKVAQELRRSHAYERDPRAEDHIAYDAHRVWLQVRAWTEENHQMTLSLQEERQ